MPYTYNFKKASNTATVSIFRFDREREIVEVLLGLRSSSSEVYPNRWCLIGGFINPGDENLRQCASRETQEEAGLVIDPDRWISIGESSHPDTDPRDHVINNYYGCMVLYEDSLNIKAADDIQALKWIEMYAACDEDLAFNHNFILRDTIEKMKVLYPFMSDNYSGFGLS